MQVLLLSCKRSHVALQRYGDEGAAWKVPTKLLNKNSICYCAGVGENISFEQGLYSEVKPNLFLFDPTPRSVKFIKKQKLPKKIQFHNWGLWSKNSTQKFFAPPLESYVSHSIVNLHNTKEYFVAECKSLEWIMKQLGHARLDMLKIDIEGAEYMVLNQLLKSKIRPTILAVEFDQPTPVKKTFAMIRHLIDAGYTLADQTDWNFIFLFKQENI